MKTIKRKTLLYKSGVEYADYCINHVEGCAHGCKFPCYAMMMKKRLEPYSAPYKDRIKSLKYLHNKGLKTWISMEPYPTPNLVEQDLEKILKEVSFVDKIIFGKLNYNVTSSQFGVNGDFYHNCADTVIKFCKDNGIEYHIKYGTQKKDNRKTERIFIKNTVQDSGLKYAKQPALSF